MLQELVDYLGKSPIAEHYNSLPEDDPQRELLVSVVTHLINPDIEEEKMEEALEGTRKAFKGTLVLGLTS